MLQLQTSVSRTDGYRTNGGHLLLSVAYVTAQQPHALSRPYLYISLQVVFSVQHSYFRLLLLPRESDCILTGLPERVLTAIPGQEYRRQLIIERRMSNEFRYGA